MTSLYNMTKLTVGIPKEIKKNEGRVAITPDGVDELTSHDINVFVETGAGLGASISDEAYIKAGKNVRCKTSVVSRFSSKS